MTGSTYQRTIRTKHKYGLQTHAILKNGTGMCPSWDGLRKNLGRIANSSVNQVASRDEWLNPCVKHVCSLSKVYPLTHGSHKVHTWLRPG